MSGGGAKRWEQLAGQSKLSVRGVRHAEEERVVAADARGQSGAAADQQRGEEPATSPQRIVGGQAAAQVNHPSEAKRSEMGSDKLTKERSLPQQVRPRTQEASMGNCNDDSDAVCVQECLWYGSMLNGRLGPCPRRVYAPENYPYRRHRSRLSSRAVHPPRPASLAARRSGVTARDRRRHRWIGNR